MTPQRSSLAGLALVLVAACSSGSSNGSPAPSPAPAATTTAPAAATTAPGASASGSTHDLRMVTGNRFSVGTLTIKAGDTVKVSDVDPDVPHNFTVAGVGHSKTMNNGDTFSLTFPTAGSFDFVCTFHVNQGMEGTITVQ